MTGAPLEQKQGTGRQQIRRALLILAVLSMPVTFLYISFIVILTGAAQGVASASMVLFAGIFLVSLVAGRAWCGWLCPGGGWSDICGTIRNQPVGGGRWDLLKYGVFVLWAGLLVLLIAQAGGLHGVEIFYNIQNGISFSSVQVLIPYFLVMGGLFLLVTVVGKRAFCRYACPWGVLQIIGRKIGNLARLPALNLTAESTRCTDCKKCSKECPMGLDVNGMVKKREMESPDCILCASCADICPKGAITYGVKGR